MKMSKMFMPTLREVPSDAEITSHQLMLRAGMIKKMSSGIYNQLPMGLRVFNKIQKIVREELENKGCQEILCAGMIPAELWKESGRWDVMGAEMFRLQDRNERDFCLGPTHEEVFTDIIRQEITSYKQLPLNLYQIQVKYRDERRPRFGVMRTKTFTMKDGYSFDVDQEGLDKSYQDMFDAYTNIFARCGLENSPVQADTGAIGGSVSAEFMVKSEVGEDEIVFCSSCDYAANMEKAVAVESQGSNEDMLANEEIHTPGVKSIEELQEFTKYPMHKLAKTLVYVIDGKTVVVVLRGDRELNEVKMGNAIGGAVEIEMADASVIESIFNADAGSLGPINIKPDYLLIDQEVAVEKNVVIGANKTDYHILNVNFGRDFDGIVGDFKNVTEADKCTKCGNHFEIARGVEVGHIFKLGTKYSEAMGANFIDKDGKSKPMVMGCYGIGIERTAASIVEQHHDENGISWPLSVAPYHVVVVPVNIKKAEHMEAAEKIYNELAAMGVEVLLDDRDERAGVKFKDSELIGIPMRITVGKDIVDGKVEFKLRKADEKEVISLDEIKSKVEAEFTKSGLSLV